MTNAELDEKLALAARAAELGWTPDVYAARLDVPGLVAAVRGAQDALAAAEKALALATSELEAARAPKLDAPKPAPPKPPAHRRGDAR